jgi:hypothetical protein
MLKADQAIAYELPSLSAYELMSLTAYQLPSLPASCFWVRVLRLQIDDCYWLSVNGYLADFGKFKVDYGTHNGQMRHIDHGRSQA